MLKKLKLSGFFLMIVLSLSCSPNAKGTAGTAVKKAKEVKEAKELKKISDSLTIASANPVLDDRASFISGVEGGKTECLLKLNSSKKWNLYAKDLDSLFSHTNSFRIKKMKSWADSELIYNQNVTTVFYPFSGPDFLTADIFYPDADQYIMIGLEPIGYIPDICKMHPDSVTSYLNTINNSLKDIFKRSYFITMTMGSDLKKTKANGCTPLISLFIKRTGHQILSIQRIGVDSLGKLQVFDSMKYRKSTVPGVKIDFLSLSKKKVQSVYYFRTDISDKGLAKYPGFKIYMSHLPQSFSYLKAASYLMHSNEFKMIRNIIFDVSATILQDDSGIAYKYFDKTKWDIRLYGKYQKPGTEFSYISEPDLEKAYKSAKYRPLSYTIGYNWRAGNSNMLYAIKIKPVAKK
jgi:hypothetical protein